MNPAKGSSLMPIFSCGRFWYSGTAAPGNVPDVCFGEAQEYIPQVAKRRGNDSSLALTVLEEVSRIVVSVDLSLYESYEKLARERIQRRDPDDWPVVAVALMLGVPVWTEDQDFFGSGIPTWTTDRVELYLRRSA